MTWLTGWPWCKSHDINGSTAGAQTNYPIKINVHRGSGSDNTNDVYCDCNEDFSDIRFTGGGGALLDYWVESITGNSAVVWVEVDSIPASPGTASIYMYYGKSDAKSASNGDSTFLFFDDFSGSRLNNLKWNTWKEAGAGGGYDVSNSELHVSGGTANWQKVGSKSMWGYPVAYRYRGRFDESNSSEIGSDDRTASGSGSGYIGNGVDLAFFGVGAYRVYREGNSTSQTRTSDLSANIILEIRRTSSSVSFYENNTLKATLTSNVPLDNQGVYAGASNSNVYLDWCLVRKYVEQEPSNGEWGNQLYRYEQTIDSDLKINYGGLTVDRYTEAGSGVTIKHNYELLTLPPILPTEGCMYKAYTDPGYGNILFKHTGSPYTAYANIYMVMLPDPINPNEYGPLIAIDRGLFVEKDIQTYGALFTSSDPVKGTGGGAVLIGHGFYGNPSFPPCIVVTDSGFDTLYLLSKTYTNPPTQANLSLAKVYIGKQVDSDKCLEIGYDETYNFAYMQIRGDQPNTGLTIANQGTLYAGHGIYPATGASIKDCGNSTLKWDNIWAVTVHQGDAVFANGWRLTEDTEESGMLLVRADGSVAQKWR